MQLLRGTIAIWLLVMLAGCGLLGPSGSNSTRASDLGDPDCAGTHAGRACLTIHFGVHRGIRDSAPGDLKGYLEWGLYRGGDVGLLGPGDNVKVLGTPERPAELPYVDFSVPGSEYVVTFADVEARDYQIVGYLDDDDSGKPDTGDPVTFPRDPFDVPADVHTDVDALLDYIR